MLSRGLLSNLLLSYSYVPKLLAMVANFEYIQYMQFNAKTKIIMYKQE